MIPFSRQPSGFAQSAGTSFSNNGIRRLPITVTQSLWKWWFSQWFENGKGDRKMRILTRVQWTKHIQCRYSGNPGFNKKNARKSTRRCARFTCIDCIQCIDCIDCGDCRDCIDCGDCRMYGLQRLYTYMDMDCRDQQLKISHKTFLWDISPS